MEGKIAKLSVFPESGDVGYGDESDVVAIIQIMPVSYTHLTLPTT